ncbi:MAG: hypothetical protein U1F83_06215 [Verrucomicrobiota bacterium]
MRASDLVKPLSPAGTMAYLVYEFPKLGQGMIIATLSLLWLSYLYSTVMSRRLR